MKDKSERLPVADQIRKGLEEAIRHAKGEIALKTTTLEMPDRPPDVEAEELVKLRLTNGMSQTIFARMLNVSAKTVQSWEQGQRKPSPAALRLIQVFRQDPAGLIEFLGCRLGATDPADDRDLTRRPDSRGDLRLVPPAAEIRREADLWRLTASRAVSRAMPTQPSDSSTRTRAIRGRIMDSEERTRSAYRQFRLTNRSCERGKSCKQFGRLGRTGGSCQTFQWIGPKAAG
jgi:putative transcriptional regulator